MPATAIAPGQISPAGRVQMTRPWVPRQRWRCAAEQPEILCSKGTVLPDPSRIDDGTDRLAASTPHSPLLQSVGDGPSPPPLAASKPEKPGCGVLPNSPSPRPREPGGRSGWSCGSPLVRCGTDLRRPTSYDRPSPPGVNPPFASTSTSPVSMPSSSATAGFQPAENL